MPAARSCSWAVTVVRRSSWVTTGTGSTAARASTSASTAFAAGPMLPSRQRGRPTTTVTASSSATMVGDPLVVDGADRRPLEREPGEASIPPVSLAATPMRAASEVEPERPPGGRTHPSERTGEVEGRVDPLGVLAPGDGEVGALPPPPLMALEASAMSSPACRPLSRAHRRDQGGAAAGGRAAEHDGPDAGPVAHGDGEVAQAVAFEAVDARDDDAVDRLGGEVGGAAGGQLAGGGRRPPCAAPSARRPACGRRRRPRRPRR